MALAIDGTHLIPLTDAVRARFHQADRDADKVEGFYELTQGIVSWAQELSRGWMVLYAHCEFFGGDGIHAAVARHQESIIFGPRFTRTRGELADPPYQAADLPDMAINAGLRALGIQAAGRHDEFATISLGKHQRLGHGVEPGPHPPGQPDSPIGGRSARPRRVPAVTLRGRSARQLCTAARRGCPGAVVGGG